MADDFRWLEGALGAVSKLGADNADLVGARCPKCEASSFVKISDLYSQAVGRLEEQQVDAAAVARQGGMTDMQIVERFKPPQRKSVAGIMLLVAIPLGAGAFYAYRRFGPTLGQASIVAAIVVTVIVLMTSLRRLSDDYYHRRKRWNSLFMCRRCGQLVAP